MNLVEYKERIKNPLRPRTVTFLEQDEGVLLVVKLRGFGKGNYLGVGGKVEESKDRRTDSEDSLSITKNAASREIFEEIDVTVAPEDLFLVSILRFYFPHIADESWNQEVYVFTAKKWEGEPRAKEDEKGQIEVEPYWTTKVNLPLNKMWDDARYWLPEILNGKKLDGEFVFDENLKVTDYSILYK